MPTNDVFHTRTDARQSAAAAAAAGELKAAMEILARGGTVPGYGGDADFRDAGGNLPPADLPEKAWGGARPGSGRPPVGRRRVELDTETARLLHIVALHHDLSVQQIIARWTRQAWQELDAEYQTHAGTTGEGEK